MHSASKKIIKDDYLSHIGLGVSGRDVSLALGFWLL